MLLQTSDATVTLTDMVFMMGNSVARNFRLEGRAASAKTGANSFQFGGALTTAPTVSVGDTYTGIVKLAMGSYTDPGTSVLSVTGNATVSGTLAVAGNTTITGT